MSKDSNIEPIDAFGWFKPDGFSINISRFEYTDEDGDTQFAYDANLVLIQLLEDGSVKHGIILEFETEVSDYALDVAVEAARVGCSIVNQGFDILMYDENGDEMESEITMKDVFEVLNLEQE